MVNGELASSRKSGWNKFHPYKIDRHNRIEIYDLTIPVEMANFVKTDFNPLISEFTSSRRRDVACNVSTKQLRNQSIFRGNDICKNQITTYTKHFSRKLYMEISKFIIHNP